MCLLSCGGPVCNLDCKQLCSSCKGCSPCCTPHPFNCKYFFSCNSGTYDIKQCPPNTGYNPNTFSCEADMPCYLSDCLTTCTNLDCSEDCCLSNGCSSYFQCKDGERKLKFCRNGKFNPTSLMCEKDYHCSPNDKRVLNKKEFLTALYSIYEKLDNLFW